MTEALRAYHDASERATHTRTWRLLRHGRRLIRRSGRGRLDQFGQAKLSAVRDELAARGVKVEGLG